MVGSTDADELDRLIHERMRLGIVSALAAEERLSFADLKAILNTTDGNLSVHARKLEKAGYIKVDKGFENRKPRTEYSLTPLGRRALEVYIDRMDVLLNDAREALEKK
jgi:DNA-binding HxlR family transcriptional regulator